MNRYQRYLPRIEIVNWVADEKIQKMIRPVGGLAVELTSRIQRVTYPKVLPEPA